MKSPSKAKRARKQHQQPEEAEGNSNLGLIVAIVGASLAVVMVVIGGIAMPKMLEARKHGNEAAAIGSLKTITTAQSLFREGDHEADTNFDYGTLTELAESGLIDGVLGSGVKQGYTFTCEPSPYTSEFLWFASASPVSPGTTGDYHFACNQAGVVYYSLDAPIQSGPDCRIPESLEPVGR